MDINKIMDIMNTIEYGFKDKNGYNLVNSKLWDNFSNFYYLLSPEETLDKKCGVCWDQVELERKLFKDLNIECETYFIYMDNKEELPSHTFLVYKEDDLYYWFEHSWESEKGIHPYKSKNELLKDVCIKFEKSNTQNGNFPIYLYRYQKPKYHITCDEFYTFIYTQEKIDRNFL